jgi:hypothetical protein
MIALARPLPRWIGAPGEAPVGGNITDEIARPKSELIIWLRQSKAPRG